MKLAISNLAWNPTETGHVIRLMHKYGFTGLEIAPTKLWASPTHVSDDALLAYRQSYSDRGIEVVALQSLFYGKDTNVFTEEGFEHLKKNAHIAEMLGAKIMVLGSPKNRKGAFSQAVEFFQRTAEEGIPLCLEPNPPQYGCDFIHNTEEAMELIHAVNHKNFRLHLDSGILTLNGEDITEHPAHFHISQPYLAPVGPGIVDHPAIVAALKEKGYNGWCSVEMLPSKELESSMAFTAEIYGG